METIVSCLDPFYGLLLVPNLVEAYDKGYISFMETGEIMISEIIDKIERETLALNTELNRSAADYRSGINQINYSLCSINQIRGSGH